MKNKRRIIILIIISFMLLTVVGITIVNNNVFTLEKLLSLLPEYVVPYMIHLLAHDPDFTRSQDVDQLRDIKE